jgi:maleate isomerase
VNGDSSSTALTERDLEWLFRTGPTDRLGAYRQRDPVGRKRDLKRIFGLFPVLTERLQQRAGTLSGGEQQMLAIGRALMAEPRLLMLDEPFLGLAPKLIDRIVSALQRIRVEGTTALLVEQNLCLALALADRGYVLQTGRIVLTGTVSELLGNEEVRRAYLGIDARVDASRAAARVGLLVPSSNTTMEPDLWDGLAGLATVHTARMRLVGASEHEERRMVAAFAEPAAIDLATCRPDILVFGCTSAGGVLGAAGERALLQRLSGITGCPVVSVVDAVTSALTERDAQMVGLLTPYTHDLTAAVATRLAAAGVRIGPQSSMGFSDNLDIGALQPEAVVDAARPFADAPIDALFISCTNLRAYEVRDEVAQTIGRPVVTSNAAVLEPAQGLPLLRPSPLVGRVTACLCRLPVFVL